MPRKKKQETEEMVLTDEMEVSGDDVRVDGTESIDASLEEIVPEGDENTRIPVMRQLGIAFGMLVLIFGTALANDIRALFPKTSEAEAEVTQIPSSFEEEPAKLQTFVEPPQANTIIGKAAFVWDVVNQRALFNKEADEQLPLASITKLMTALVAYELLEPKDTIEISLEALDQSGDSGLLGGEQFTAADLSNLTLIVSSNDGAYALAAAAGATLSKERPADTFVEAMNIRAEELGLTQTYFNNPTGLDVDMVKNGGYGSARDIAFLMEYIITKHPDLLEQTAVDETQVSNESGASHYAQNTNEIVADIDGLIASKTGFTDLAGGNLVVAFNAGLNRPIIAVVLGSTKHGRFSDILTLTEYAREVAKQTDLK